MLRRHLSNNYIIRLIYADELADGAWVSSASLVVLPGGRDTPYVEYLAGLANENLIRFVSGGGKFIGLCAGSYYASAYCEFEKDNPELRVVGERPLRFFSGTCRGATFDGFDYFSEAGARAADITTFPSGDTIPMYYNGGVLATYKGLNDTTPNVTAILTKVGNGLALLSAVHPEYIPSGTHLEIDAPIISNRRKIYLIVRNWLRKLDLELNETTTLELEPTMTLIKSPNPLLYV
ncbi:biotin holocarboxylase synthetase [Massospora cicadina]|nr:biotin holocarboxylase synthetase [Massospora cicadina]